MDQRILKPQSSSAERTYDCTYKPTTGIPASKLSFDELWVINQPRVLSNNGGDTYLEHYIHEGLLKVADETGIDAGVLLAVMMEQSGGKAAMPCRRFEPGSTRCGLMGVLNGSLLDQTPLNEEESVRKMLMEGAQEDALSSAATDTTTSDPFRPNVLNRLLGWDGSGKGHLECNGPL